MIKYRESTVSAYHNYLVNGMLTPGFLVGDKGKSDDFYFLAHPLFPEESPGRISGRLLNERGLFLLELNSNQIIENPGGCSSQSIPGGFRIVDPSDEPLLEVRTHNFTNGLLTRIKAKLFDEYGVLRIEPFGDSVQIHGTSTLILEKSPLNMP